MVEAVTDTGIKSVVQFHDFLQMFRSSSLEGTAIMEIKRVQELESVDQDPLFLVFQYLSKAYDNLYWGRLLQTLEGYGAGLKL